MIRFNKVSSYFQSNIIKRCLTTFNDYLEVKFEDRVKHQKFYYFWLRDHCRCSKCYNIKTHQISSNILTIPFDIKPKKCEKSDEKLFITWNDEHKTEFSLNWLKTSLHYNDNQNEISFWDKNTVENIHNTRVSYKYYMESDEGLKNLLSSILKYGFGFVTEVQPSLSSTEDVIRRITHVQKTIFGEMWEVTNDLLHADTAYTNTPLGAHTDNTYYHEASGLQVFHMLSHSGQGGETLLVDGFNATNKLQTDYPEAFMVLCNNSLGSEFIDNGMHYTALDPVIRLHPITKKLLQIRYNIYDRMVLNTIDEDSILQFYKSYILLGTEINKPENEWWLKLEPGSVLFIDNWRVLHGRASYTGKRNLCGAYVGRSDWLSRATHFGLV